MAVGRAEPTEVNNFDELSSAVVNEEENIVNIKPDITFNDAIIIERGNLTISGPGGGGKSN
jgi:hypothetical protein